VGVAVAMSPPATFGGSVAYRRPQLTHFAAGRVGMNGSSAAGALGNVNGINRSLPQTTQQRSGVSGSRLVMTPLMGNSHQESEADSSRMPRKLPFCWTLRSPMLPLGSEFVESEPAAGEHHYSSGGEADGLVVAANPRIVVKAVQAQEGATSAPTFVDHPQNRSSTCTGGGVQHREAVQVECVRRGAWPEDLIL
jgi:hypothetical protein